MLSLFAGIAEVDESGMADVTFLEMDDALLDNGVQLDVSSSGVQVGCGLLVCVEDGLELVQLDATPLDCEACKPSLLVPGMGGEDEETP